LREDRRREGAITSEEEPPANIGIDGIPALLSVENLVERVF